MTMLIQNGDGQIAYVLAPPAPDAPPPAAAAVVLDATQWQFTSGADGSLKIDPPAGAGGANYWHDLQRALDGAAQNAPFDIYQLLALLAEFAATQQLQDRQERQADLAVKIGKLTVSADEVVQAALSRFIGAVTGGTLQLVAGATGVAGGVVGLKGVYSANARISADATAAPAGALQQDPDFQIRQFNKLTMASQGVGHLLQGVSSATTGVGQIVSGSLDFQAAGHERDKLNSDKGAEVADAARSSDSESLQRHLEVQKSILDTISAIERERHETAQGQARAV